MSQLRLLSNAALDAIVAMDTEGKILEWNPQAEALFGWSRDDVLGETVASKIVPERDRQQHTDSLKRYLKTGEALILNKRIEVSACKRDGGELDVELAIVPHASDKGAIFIAFIRDISERSKLQRSMERNLAFSQVMYEATELVANDGSFDELLRGCLKKISQITDWPIGHVLLAEPYGAPSTLRSTNLWAVNSDEFACAPQALEHFNFRRGEGLPGKIWEQGKPIWAAALEDDPDLIRHEQFGEFGLKTYFGFPIMRDNSCIAVLEFFSTDKKEADTGLLNFVQAIGFQLGRVIERQRALRDQETLLKELAHRVGNMTANISGLFRRSTAHASSLQSLVDSFSGRLQAMQEVQEIMTKRDWQDAQLREIAEKILLPFVGPDFENCEIEGPDLQLPASLCMTVSLILHELAENAMQHGSFSVPGGSVLVRWDKRASLGHPDELCIHWQESGGPPPDKDRNGGFGTAFIEQSIVGVLSGTMQEKFKSSGYQLKLTIPLDY